jgi:hypothetical protein
MINRKLAKEGLRHGRQSRPSKEQSLFAVEAPTALGVEILNRSRTSEPHPTSGVRAVLVDKRTLRADSNESHGGFRNAYLSQAKAATSNPDRLAGNLGISR